MQHFLKKLAKIFPSFVHTLILQAIAIARDKPHSPIPSTTYDAPSLSCLYTTMSAAAEGSGPTTKATTTTDTSSTLKDQQKPAAALEEDDEFEDFPVDGTCA